MLDRGDLLPHLLPDGAGASSTCPLVLKNRQAAQGALVARLRVRAAQGDGRLRAASARSSRSSTRARWAGSTACCRGRPFAFREALAASGPRPSSCSSSPPRRWGRASCSLTTWLVSKVSRQAAGEARGASTCSARISGLAAARLRAGEDASTRWSGSTSTSPAARRPPARSSTPSQPFGTWVLFAEIVLLGLVPALILARCRERARDTRVARRRGVPGLRGRRARTASS